MRKKPEITWRVKEGFTEVAILKYGLELTNNEITMKHWEHSGHPSRAHSRLWRPHMVGHKAAFTVGCGKRAKLHSVNRQAAEPRSTMILFLKRKKKKNHQTLETRAQNPSPCSGSHSSRTSTFIMMSTLCLPVSPCPSCWCIPSPRLQKLRAPVGSGVAAKAWEEGTPAPKEEHFRQEWRVRQPRQRKPSKSQALPGDGHLDKYKGD